MEEIKIITVVPISSGVFKEELTYFTSLEVKIGNLVSVQVRNKKIVGIVVNIKKADEIKEQIRSSEFELKKINELHINNFFSSEFIMACQYTADYFATTIGQTINFFIPQAILASIQKLEETLLPKAEHQIDSRHFEIKLLQAQDEERLASYKSLTRESLAQKKSIFICLPTVYDVTTLSDFLCKGIEQYTTILHGELGTKEIIRRWKNAINSNHPILIIATPLFLSLSRPDIRTYILENENSRSYKTINRPFIDIRIFMEKLAELQKTRLIIGDLILRLETIYDKEKNRTNSLLPIKRRFTSSNQQLLVDMKKYKPIFSKKVSTIDYNSQELNLFISQELKNILDISVAKGERTVIIVTRKGLAPTTICCDCGATVSCDKCRYPLTLYKIGGKNTYICNQCKKETPSERKCEICSSWRLKTMGIGLDRLEEILKTNFANTKVIRLDKNTRSSRQTTDLIRKFVTTKGSILIGTTIILTYLNTKIDNLAIISIDSLVNLPDFRTNERIFNIINRARDLASKNFIIQTRKTELPIFDMAVRGDFASFYRQEIEEREKYNYPPLSVLIKITREGQMYKINEEIDDLEKFLKKYQPIKYSSLTLGQDYKNKLNLLIKTRRDLWPEPTTQSEGEDMNLMDVLKTLPPRFIVDISPQDIV